MKGEIEEVKNAYGSFTNKSSSYVENVLNLEAIKKDLLNSENSIISASLPVLCTNESYPENLVVYKCNDLCLEVMQDRELLDILEELRNHEPCINGIRTSGTNEKHLQRHFCSDNVFNLSNRILSENEMKVLELGLDFQPI